MAPRNRCLERNRYVLLMVVSVNLGCFALLFCIPRRNRPFAISVTSLSTASLGPFLYPRLSCAVFLSSQRFPDTKHNLVSFSITAIKEVEVTAALELLHGMYYSEFDSMLENVGELFVFTPGRSDYKPLEPSRKSFYFLLDKADFSDLQVEKNIPVRTYAVEQLRISPNEWFWGDTPQ